MKLFRLCSASALTAVTFVAIAPWGIAGGRAQTAPPSNIQPDTTLPSPSQVTPTAAGTAITGGTTAGSNLFHSFSEFSVPAGSEVRFVPGNAAIDAIVTRVTGDFASQIDGTLAVDGNANLFLLNPNGVFFGPGASLDLRGAFVPSTADRIRFGNLGQFAADPTAGDNPQLLTVAPSALFFNQLNPAPISNAAVGLSVDPGQSFLLVGGDIAFEGGRAIAPGGNIGVVALAQPAEVDLVAEGNSLRLEVPDDFAGAPLTLNAGGGLLTSIPTASGGRIEVRAGDITLSSTAELRAETFGAVASGGIDIRGNSLTLAEGAIISTNTFGIGNGGDINVVADRVEIVGSAPVAPLLGVVLPGFDPNNPDGVDIAPEQLLGSLVDGLFAISLGPGNAGDITLNVGELAIQNGATIAATSFLPDFGGAGGNLDLAATAGATITDGSLLLSGTTGPMPSGNITIATPQLRVLGSLVTASTTGSGPGGPIAIAAADRVELTGGLPVDVGIPISSGLFTATVGSGSAGDLAIDTGELVIQAGASATTSSLGAGASGTLTVNATLT
ncbi:MAG: filamentous hemagglutinin N-terminal domain-containing protein, partial [Cyanobacteria bacterium J06641_5]